MGMTMTEKILARASGGGTVKPGDVAVVDVETAVLMDMTFLPEGWREILKVHDPEQDRHRFRPPGAGSDRPGCPQRIAPAARSPSVSVSSGCTMSAPTRASAMPSWPIAPMPCPALCW